MRPHGRWGAALYVSCLNSMRTLIVGCRQAGETPLSMAGAGAVSPATVRKWLRRQESNGIAGRQDRTRRRTRITSEQTRKIETPLSPPALPEDRPRGRAFRLASAAGKASESEACGG